MRTLVATFDADFQEFWQRFPRKIGKLAAKKEYDKVRRGGIPPDELLDGIAQYIATKPAYADFCHPRTWLSQGRWMDETSAPVKPASLSDVWERQVPWTCPHTPHCHHPAACRMVAQRTSAGRSR